jgi:glycosyltransferase involved in cell wall biosynthesis
MRIIHVLGKISKNYASGIASHVMELSSFQKKQGHEVLIVSYLMKEHEDDEYLNNFEDIKIINLRGTSGHDLRICYRLYSAIREFKPDIVHYHVIPIISFLSHIFNKTYKIINTFHIIDAANTHEKIWRHFLDGIVAVSPTCMKFNNPDGKKYNKSIWKVFYIGVNKAKFNREKFNEDFSTLKLIMVCRIDKMKNPDHGVLISKILNEKYKIKTELTILGNGEYEEDLRKFIVDNNSEPYVSLKGFSKDPYETLKKSHLFLVLSWWEAFSLSALESVACGIPVISYNIKGGFLDWFKDSNCGLVTSENTPEKVAEEISLLYKDKKRILQYSDNASIMTDKFDMTVKAREMVEFYKEIISRPKHSPQVEVELK